MFVVYCTVTVMSSS